MSSRSQVAAHLIASRVLTVEQAWTLGSSILNNAMIMPGTPLNERANDQPSRDHRLINADELALFEEARWCADCLEGCQQAKLPYRVELFTHESEWNSHCAIYGHNNFKLLKQMVPQPANAKVACRQVKCMQHVHCLWSPFHSRRCDYDTIFLCVQEFVQASHHGHQTRHNNVRNIVNHEDDCVSTCTCVLEAAAEWTPRQACDIICCICGEFANLWLLWTYNLPDASVMIVAQCMSCTDTVPQA